MFIAPSTAMNAEVQEECPKTATPMRIRRNMAAGRIPVQNQLRACQPAIPAAMLQAAHQVSTNALLEVSDVVQRLATRPMTAIAAMARPVPSRRRDIETRKGW
jgi:hypothetical protein